MNWLVFGQALAIIFGVFGTGIAMVVAGDWWVNDRYGLKATVATMCGILAFALSAGIGLIAPPEPEPVYCSSGHEVYDCTRSSKEYIDSHKPPVRERSQLPGLFMRSAWL